MWGGAQQVKIIPRYFDKSSAHEFGADASLVVCRHCLEHVGEPFAFLSAIRECVNENSLIYFEVPRLEWIIENRAFYDFFYEHCNYFTRQSLELIFYRAGFRVLDIKPSFKGQYCLIFAQIREKQLAPTIKSLKLESHKNIAIWGSGAKGVTLANALENVVCVIDINPRKQNCFIPKCATPILALESALKSQKIECILVMNPNYLREIKIMIRAILGKHKIRIKCVV